MSFRRLAYLCALTAFDRGRGDRFRSGGSGRAEPDGPDRHQGQPRRVPALRRRGRGDREDPRVERRPRPRAAAPGQAAGRRRRPARRAAGGPPRVRPRPRPPHPPRQPAAQRHRGAAREPAGRLPQRRAGHRLGRHHRPRLHRPAREDRVPQAHRQAQRDDHGRRAHLARRRSSARPSAWRRCRSASRRSPKRLDRKRESAQAIETALLREREKHLARSNFRRAELREVQGQLAALREKLARSARARHRDERRRAGPAAGRARRPPSVS